MKDTIVEYRSKIKIDGRKNNGGRRKGSGRRKGVSIISDIQRHCFDFMEKMLKDEAIRLKATKQLSLTFEQENKKDVLYIVKIEDKYKIGFSTNWNARKQSYKTHSPKYELIYLLKSKKSWDLEGKLHLMFNKKQIHGEWFNLNNEDLLKCVLFCAKEVYNG
tara:strand:+ start:57 stop:542 length:486 start_codon:yes stop_codon:yes gene_type:complete